MSKNGLIGFVNIGNTCYMNSTLQCLKFTVPLSKFFLLNDINTDSSLLNNYQLLVKKSWTADKPFPPINFKRSLGTINRLFMGSNQHDAHELLICILDQLNTNLLKQNITLITDLFRGYYKQTIKCMECNYESITKQEFMTLELPINGSNIHECLVSYLSEEKLEENNMYKCEKCKKYVCAIKRLEIGKLPKFLIITLKRFNRNQKINNNVSIPIKNFNLLDSEYNLYGTINHFGNLNGGHYTANILYLFDKWYNMNDSKCSEIDSNEISNSSVYIAFYYRDSINK